MKQNIEVQYWIRELENYKEIDLECTPIRIDNFRYIIQEGKIQEVGHNFIRMSHYINSDIDEDKQIKLIFEKFKNIYPKEVQNRVVFTEIEVK